MMVAGAQGTDSGIQRTKGRLKKAWTLRFRKPKSEVDWKRLFFICLGLTLFLAVYFSPAWPAAIDPVGESFPLTPQGKAAVGLFLIAAVWWVFEVVPIGVTSVMIGVIQALFLIRPDVFFADGGRAVKGTELAFKEFFHPSVWFIFGSIVIGMVFTKTGLTRRLAYKMLMIVGERTSMIYLGCFVLTAALTHVMAHTAVAATVFPLLVAIYRLYQEDERPTKFGKGLFIGMAFIAGAGSIVTLLGAARGAVAIGFYTQITGEEISFFGLTKYMFLVGWVMTFVLWGLIMVLFKPERARVPGLRQRANELNQQLGGITGQEIVAALIIGAAVLTLSLRSFVPALASIDKSGVILLGTVLFFLLGILDGKDLEQIPWNIILLFGGAMSLGYCLVETGAADWIAVNAVSFLQTAPAIVFILGRDLLRTHHDQPDHERRRHRHLRAGCAEDRSLPGCRQRGHPLWRAGRRRHALPPVGRRCAERDRIREQAVLFRRVLQGGDSGQPAADGRGRGLRHLHLADDGHGGSDSGRDRGNIAGMTPFHIVHLSDLHLTRSDGRPRSEPDILKPLRGMNQTFRRVLATAPIQRSDLILITGDITDRGDSASWEVFASAVADAGVEDRVLLLPGNHDVCCLGARLPGSRRAYRLEDLRRACRGLARGMSGSRVECDGGLPVRGFPLVALPDPRVVIFCLNSNFLGNLNVVSNALGKVDYYQLLSLASKMRRFRDVPVKIVALHHSPNIPAPATARKRGQKAFNVLARLGHQVSEGQRRAIRLLCVTHRVRLLVHGHLHMAEDRRVNGVRIVGAPATTEPVAVRPGGAEYQFYSYTVQGSGERVRTELRSVTL